MWVVTTDRADVATEYASSGDYERVPTNVFVRLDNDTRLRLGGAQGLELGVVVL